MKEGDLVLVYEDPITQTKIEGCAYLVSKIDCDMGGKLERWNVRLELQYERVDDRVFERTIVPITAMEARRSNINIYNTLRVQNKLH